MSMARKFAAYLSAYDARTEVPPYRLLPVYSHRRAPRFYRDEDVRRLIDATRQIMTRKRLAGATYSTLFGLLAVTGMRVGEAIGMDCKDVDLERNLLTLRRTKGNKSRLVPIHPSTGHELGEYEKLRNQVFPRPVSSGFFISERSTALDYSSTFQRFLKMARQIGLRGPKGTTGVRLHDLRHRFAIRTLEKWYSSDSNAEQRLPQLATYLGHGQVRDTYWYLSATPELLKLAIRRLQGRKGGRTA
jgi:integrase